MVLLLFLKLTALLVCIITLFFLFFWLWSVITLFRTRVPFAKTPKKNIEIILQRLNLPKDSVFYDLGCGDGRALFVGEKYGLRPIGYELSLYPYLKCKIKKFFKGSNIVVRRKDFFKEDLSEAKVVYIFLVGGVLGKLSKKLSKELKPGTIVVSYGFGLPGWQGVDILNTSPSKIYIYNVSL
ncbi:MAG: hypothetical protein KKE11_00050 [Gammaproteobacteria bacterium]|nr:hypothetical protein [Gammaproteobacteria bacterium]